MSPRLEERVPSTAGVRVGHLHLHVGDVPQALTFYVDLLGFELQFDLTLTTFLILILIIFLSRHLGMSPPGG